MIVKSSGSTVITAQTVFSGMLGGYLNGWVMFIKLSNKYLVLIRYGIRKVVRKWLFL